MEDDTPNLEPSGNDEADRHIMALVTGAGETEQDTENTANKLAILIGELVDGLEAAQQEVSGLVEDSKAKDDEISDLLSSAERLENENKELEERIGGLEMDIEELVMWGLRAGADVLAARLRISEDGGEVARVVFLNSDIGTLPRPPVVVPRVEVNRRDVAFEGFVKEDWVWTT